MEHLEGAESRVVALPVAAAVVAQLERDALAEQLASRLRHLRRICAAMLASVAMLAAASLVVGRMLVPAVPVAASSELSLTLTALAAILILLTSRFQSAILRRSAGGVVAHANRTAAAAGAGAGKVSPNPVAAPGAAAAAPAAAVADAYARATIVGFALLDCAAALGLVVAAVTGTARYALVICAAAALGMLARWPRRAAALALLRRSGSTGAAA